jgi:desampylase
VNNRVRIERGCVQAIEQRARENLSVECCGLLTGRAAVISQIIPARNAAENPANGYEIAPNELIPLLRAIRESGQELLGIYHSHPRSENVPSRTDVEMAAYPGAAYFIFSPLASPEKSLRAFSIRDGEFAELAIEIV